MMKFALVLMALVVLMLDLGSVDGTGLKAKANVTHKVNVTHEGNRTVIPHGCPRGEGVVYRPFFECSQPIDCDNPARHSFRIPGCGCGCKEANCTATSFNIRNTSTCPYGYRCITDGCLLGARKANLTVTCAGVCKPLLS